MKSGRKGGGEKGERTGKEGEKKGGFLQHG